MLIGTPACGKTSLATDLMIVHPGMVYLSADKIREDLYGDAGIQGDGKRVFNILYTRLEQAVSDRKNIIIDNTNVRLKHRNKIRSYMTDDYRVSYTVFKTPLAECLRRNALRERVVPESVIRDFHKILEEQDFSQEIETESIVYIYAP